MIGKLLRFRYVVLCSGAGGTYYITQKYEQLKSHLPSMGMFESFLPSSDLLDSSLTSLKTSVNTARDYTKDVSHRLWISVRSLFPTRGLESNSETPFEVPQQHSNDLKVSAVELDVAEKPSRKSRVTVEELQEAIFKKELEYHKRIENLLRENRELRGHLLLKQQKSTHKGRIKRSLIELYSELLDELQDLDSAYNIQDQLPRVVVVGDQSSGKTSVLEMIAQARIFPRGSGEMMTRSPVKVTLSEGPYHVASFSDTSQEYDLTKEADLAALRRDIEMRMRALVSGGKTISPEVISLSVKGPGLQRIVLVDLPGIISTVTSGMQSDTRDVVKKLACHYMSNPNAIILCVQDGSIDAERSNVTDLVSSIDPQGKRTIFVLTKVDLAEANLYNPNRIRQILDGKLFPMQALGYFAVVTGRGSKDDSIQTIREYEEQFFHNSKLFRDGALSPSQLTTFNLSKAVSERFWKMVKASVEQQADTYRAIRYNMEAEWKNSFPRLREMDREELFEKARNEILDDLSGLNDVSAEAWEKTLFTNLWNHLQSYVFQQIFEPAQQVKSLEAYQTLVDIRLREWAEKQLPKEAINAGWTTLYSMLDSKLQSTRQTVASDSLFDPLKVAVHEQTRARHEWDAKAENRLNVIQSTALDDRTVHTKDQWVAAVDFMVQVLKSRLKTIDQNIYELCGPTWIQRWTRWRARNEEQKMRVEVIHEMENLLVSHTQPDAEISLEDVTTIRRNLQARNIMIGDDFIRETWQPLVRRVLTERALYTCHECRKSFYYYQQGFLPSSPTRALVNTASQMVSNQSKRVPPENGQLDATSVVQSTTMDFGDFSDCRDVILFSRILRMLDATSNALRQQIMNDEARRLESHVKQVLNELADDPIRLRRLLTGRRVELAEDLKKTRHLQEKLEEFITALNSDE